MNTFFEKSTQFCFITLFLLSLSFGVFAQGIISPPLDEHGIQTPKEGGEFPIPENYVPQVPQESIEDEIHNVDLPVDIKVPCLLFDPYDLFVDSHPSGSTSYLKTRAGHEIVDEFQDADNAKAALKIIQYYHFDSRCNMQYANNSQYNQAIAYYLCGNQSVMQSFPDEDIFSFDVDSLEIKYSTGAKWWNIHDKKATNDIFHFDTQEEAEHMLNIIHQFGFTKIATGKKTHGGTIGRPMGAFSYLVK